METVFLKLLNMSITASLLILAVVLLRALLKKAPKAISCILWALVALRLLCPVSLESKFSLLPEKLSSGEIVSEWADDYVGDTWSIREDSVFYDAAVEAGRRPVSDGEGSYYVVTGPDQLGEPATVADKWIPILCCVWLAGMTAMLFYALCSYLRLRRQVGAAMLLGDGVWLCDDVRSPFILGILRPKIYLPSDLGEERVGPVVAHERAHLRRRDHWWKPLGFVLLAVYWFNPLCWLAYILLCRDIELACDERVVREMLPDEKKTYSMALLSCSLPRRMVAACPLAFGEVGVKERIKTVLSYRKPAFWIIIVAVLACVAAAVCFLTNPPEKDSPYEWTKSVSADSISSAVLWSTETELGDAEKAELARQLNGLDKGDFTKNTQQSGSTPEYGLRVVSGGEAYLINQSIAPEGALEIDYKGGQWIINSSELAAFISGLATGSQPQVDSPEPVGSPEPAAVESAFVRRTEDGAMVSIGGQWAEKLSGVIADGQWEDGLPPVDGAYDITVNGTVYSADEHFTRLLDNANSRSLTLSDGDASTLAAGAQDAFIIPDTISVALATDELLGQYASVEEFGEAADEYSQKLVLTTETAVQGFRFFEADWDMNEEHVYPLEGETLYEASELLPEKPLVVWVDFPGLLPTKGIAYTDDNNVTRYLYFAMSGMDGSISLSQS